MLVNNVTIWRAYFRLFKLAILLSVCLSLPSTQIPWSLTFKERKTLIDCDPFDWHINSVFLTAKYLSLALCCVQHNCNEWMTNEEKRGREREKQTTIRNASYYIGWIAFASSNSKHNAQKQLGKEINSYLIREFISSNFIHTENEIETIQQLQSIILCLSKIEILSLFIGLINWFWCFFFKNPHRPHCLTCAQRIQHISWRRCCKYQASISINRIMNWILRCIMQLNVVIWVQFDCYCYRISSIWMQKMCLDSHRWWKRPSRVTYAVRKHYCLLVSLQTSTINVAVL